MTDESLSGDPLVAKMQAQIRLIVDLPGDASESQIEAHTKMVFSEQEKNELARWTKGTATSTKLAARDSLFAARRHQVAIEMLEAAGVDSLNALPKEA